MKIGESLASQRPEIRLPVEILTQIISYIPSGSAGQSTAWACCLVSHQWYSAAVSKLYEKPSLAGPNFDKFAAVICPPVNAHVRRVGLEHYVKHLDMSGIAYESTNSQTARLLRRVGPSLKDFIAPPTSFSTSCLAPLAKAQWLRYLDLRLTQSHSFSRIDIYALLRCVGKLKDLVVLSLPPSNFGETRAGDPRDATTEWPPHLTELQFNHVLPTTTWWSEIACHWPTTLHSLIIRDCKSYEPLVLETMRGTLYPQITSVHVDAVSTARDTSWITMFPQLRFVSIPGQAMELAFLWLTEKDKSIPQLEQLELTQYGEETSNFSTTRLMTQMVFWLPHLWQIQIHESFAEFDDVWADCQDAEILLKRRVKEQNEAAGQIIHDPDEAGVSFF